MTDHGISPAAVAGKNAIFAKNNAKDFGNKLTALLSNRKKLESMRQSSYILAAQYTASRQTTALINVYEQTLKSKK